VKAVLVLINNTYLILEPSFQFLLMMKSDLSC